MDDDSTVDHKEEVTDKAVSKEPEENSGPSTSESDVQTIKVEVDPEDEIGPDTYGYGMDYVKVEHLEDQSGNGTNCEDPLEVNLHTPLFNTFSDSSAETDENASTEESSCPKTARSETDEQPLACKSCGKTFLERSNLLVHLSIHSALARNSILKELTKTIFSKRQKTET